MDRRVLSIVLLVALAVAACGAPAPTDNLSASDGAARTATFESAKTRLLSERAATRTAIATAHPASTPTATARVVSTQVVVADATTSPESGVDLVPPALAAYLPDADLVPETAPLYRDMGLTAEDIAATVTDPAAHLQRLVSWGYQAGWMREFRNPDVASRPPHEVFWVRAVPIVYASAETARTANEFDRQQNIDCQCVDYTDAEIAGIGEQVLAMSGPVMMEPNVYQAWIWVQDGNTAVQYLAVATDDDPLPVLEGIVRATFDNTTAP